MNKPSCRFKRTGVALALLATTGCALAGDIYQYRIAALRVTAAVVAPPPPPPPPPPQMFTLTENFSGAPVFPRNGGSLMPSWRGASYGNALGYANQTGEIFVYVTVPPGAIEATITAATGYSYPGAPWRLEQRSKADGSWAAIPFTAGRLNCCPRGVPVLPLSKLLLV